MKDLKYNIVCYIMVGIVTKGLMNVRRTNKERYQYDKKMFHYQRKCILARHNNRCDHCGFDDVRVLELHHPEGKGQLKPYKNPFQEIRRIWKGEIPVEVLCANCHKITHLTDYFHQSPNLEPEQIST